MDDARRCLVTRMERFGPSWPQGKTLFSLFAGFLLGPRCLVRGASALLPLMTEGQRLPVRRMVMARQGGVVVADGGWGVIQGGQQVFFDIADIGGILPHPVQYLLDMGAVQFQEP